MEQSVSPTRIESSEAEIEREQEKKLLLSGIRWRLKDPGTPTINPFYDLDYCNIPDPDFWSTAAAIFTMLAKRARTQRRLAKDYKRRLEHGY